jgi:uncharacterized protein
MTWKTLNGEDVPDLVRFVEEATKANQVVHIGTDSLQVNRFTQFVTVIAILTPTKGGRAIYRREIVPRISSLRERLLKEVWRSVELGMQLAPLIPGELNIHVDANPEEKHMSSRYVQELTGLVVSQGFKAVIKPESWCSTHAADWAVRRLNSRANRTKAR